MINKKILALFLALILSLSYPVQTFALHEENASKNIETNIQPRYTVLTDFSVSIKKSGTQSIIGSASAYVPSQYKIDITAYVQYYSDNGKWENYSTISGGTIQGGAYRGISVPVNSLPNGNYRIRFKARVIDKNNGTCIETAYEITGTQTI